MSAPTVGRMVHYRSYGTPGGEYQPQCRAAVITEVGSWVDGEVTPTGDGTRTVEQTWYEEAVGLSVQNPTGLFFDRGILHAEPADHPDGLPGGTWHWPCVRTAD